MTNTFSFTLKFSVTWTSLQCHAKIFTSKYKLTILGYLLNHGRSWSIAYISHEIYILYFSGRACRSCKICRPWNGLLTATVLTMSHLVVCPVHKPVFSDVQGVTLMNQRTQQNHQVSYSHMSLLNLVQKEKSKWRIYIQYNNLSNIKACALQPTKPNSYNNLPLL